jgi:uncharacterized protein YgbK (DUF1537 family)
VAVTLIADDLTGACDAGALFTGRGPVSVVLGQGAVDAARVVVALDTESRALPPGEARRLVRATAERLGTRLSESVLFKKIDSTLRGPVGDEIDALHEASGRRISLVCPAFPDQGRTVVQGLLRIGDTPAHRSAVGLDPAYPTGTSHVSEILSRGASQPIRHIALDRVRAGSACLLDALATARGGIVSADAETNADLDALAAVATSPDIMLAGSAGLARAVAARLGHDGPAVTLPRGRGWLIVVGSLHPASRAQLASLEATGVAGAVVDSERAPDLAVIGKALRAGLPAFLATVTRGCPTPDERSRTAAALARACAHVLAECRPDLVAVTGGETAWALLGALGVDHLELSGAPASGLALGEVVAAGFPRLALLTKAGGFGPPEFLVTLLGGQA